MGAAWQLSTAPSFLGFDAVHPHPATIAWRESYFLASMAPQTLAQCRPVANFPFEFTPVINFLGSYLDDIPVHSLQCHCSSGV
jgi:hypothetical protein